MTSYDEDPLADLLSDENSDSFFEDPKVLTKRASLTKPPDKKALADLFGLDSDKAKDKAQSKDNDWLGLGEEKPKTSEPLKSALSSSEKPLPPSKPTKKISFEDDNDILNTLGFDKKPEPSSDGPNEKEAESASKKMEPAKKSALIESIFGPPKQPEQITSFEDILKESKVAKPRSPTPPVRKAEVLPEPITQASAGYAPGDFSREGRRSRHSSSAPAVRDPLGLFSNELAAQPKESDRPSSGISLARSGKFPVRAVRGEGDVGTAPAEILVPPKQKVSESKSTPNISNKDLPEWLGPGSPVKTFKSETGIKPDSGRRGSILRKEVDVPAEPVSMERVDASAANTDGSLENPMLESLLAQQKFARSHIEYQNTSIALQQQESQLLVALQLKKYEENMAEMQKKQQDVLVRQEQQFNNLLERQFAKQQVMENNMRLQQERINSHIQLLISQPPVSGRINKEEEEEEEQAHQLKKTNTEENSRLYEEMIATLKQRQHEEIFLLNESYKKQITLLEDSMEAVETRLKTELTHLSEQFRGTIEHIKNEHETEIEKYKQKLQDISALHVNEIKSIRENHNRIVEEIKYEYSTMMENMKEVKQMESSALNNANTYTQKLDSSLEMLDVNSKVLDEIRGKVQHDYGVLSLAREESFKAKEEEIKLMRMTLEKSRESAETERAQLMGLVRSLEMKLMEQNQNAREERWALQQAAAVLTARSAAFDREIEFTRTSLDREKDQLKTLKESMLAEQEKLMLQVTEEKLAVAAEKSRLETSARLNQNYDTQKARAEVDAAIQVAKEAAELTDRERANLHRQQSEIESLKRNLLDKQQTLALKENELRSLLLAADRKAKDGDKALMEAKSLEAKYNARLRDIQGQLVSLTSREKKLAEDKIALSKERVALHNNLRQAKPCSLCVTENIRTEDNNYAVDRVEQDFSPRILAVTDPDVLRFRYEINEERALAPKNLDDSDSKID